MPSRFRSLALAPLAGAVLLVALVAGCASSDGASSDGTVEEEPVWSEGALRDHLGQLTAPVASADSALAARRTLYAVRRMRAAGLMPAREPSFLVRQSTPRSRIDGPASLETSADPAQAHVLGYVTGRHPSHYDELVLVAADLNAPGAAAVLETARALAARARYTQTPERSVLFALWAPPRTGALGLSDFLANPTWALPNVVRALLVTTEPASVAESLRVLRARGIPVDVVTVEDQSVAAQGGQPEAEQARRLARTGWLTDALYARVLATAAGRDSTAVSL
jgi:hypothetical protein